MNAYPMVHPDTFKANPLINKLKSEPFWTVSDVNKRPIDAVQYLTTGEIWGASMDGEHPLVTLDQLDADDNLQAVNRAYRLRARENNVIVVDVEPHAPNDMKASVFDFPAHFTELSTNGGVHLLIQVPDDCINDDNRYMFEELSVFKEPVEKGIEREAHFEVIFNDHFITFTKRMHTTKPAVDYDNDPAAKAQLQEFLNRIVQMDKDRKEARRLAKQHKVELVETALDDEKKQLVAQFLNLRALKRTKEDAMLTQPSKYGGDMSRYEMGVASMIASGVLRVKDLAGNTLTFRNIVTQLGDTELIYAIYTVLKESVDYRDKHDEERDDMPWLVYTAKNAYEYIKSKKKQK